MDAYALLLYAHLLLFVYWLGADVGVFGRALGRFRLLPLATVTPAEPHWLA